MFKAPALGFRVHILQSIAGLEEELNIWTVNCWGLFKACIESGDSVLVDNLWADVVR